jgi:DNA-directed RNA polymerase subunit RPC12/RpoP
LAARMCPHCKAEVTAANVVAYTNGVDCPKCGMRLEVASGARTISTWCGLAAAAIAWRLASGSAGDLGGVLPTLYAFLAFGIVSAVALMITANLRNAPASPAPEPVHSGAGHASGGHDGGDHGPHH